MDLPSLRRLALADVGEPELDWMARHGEDLLVEHKAEPPNPPGLGAEVASFANTIGGWLLIGIDNSGEPVGWDPGRVDRQSYLGDLLRNQVDPVPPFIAGERQLDGKPVTVVRVLESADAPILVRGTGALYVRDSGGKHPVDDHRTLMALTQRGAQAERAARARLRELEVVYRALIPPDLPNPSIAAGLSKDLRIIVRASPLTVTPQFSGWPIKGPIGWFQTVAMNFFHLPNDDNLIEGIQPRGRGLAGRYSCRGDARERQLRLVADSGGVIAASLAQRSASQALETVRNEFIHPLIDMVAASLVKAEAMGRSVWDAWVSIPQGVPFAVIGGADRLPAHTPCAGSLTLPATDDELADLADEWTREFGRACGIEAWEPGLE